MSTRPQILTMDRPALEAIAIENDLIHPEGNNPIEIIRLILLAFFNV